VRAFALLAAAGLACGHAPPTGAPARTSAYVTAYPALRWVPADATYVVTSRKVSDAVAVVRELVGLDGMRTDYDVAEAEHDLERELGVDPLSADNLRSAGVDLDGGAVMFSKGLSVTLAIALSDPQRTTGFLDEHRGNAVVEVEREQGVDIYTYRMDRHHRVHWAIADGWLFVHLEVVDEHEAELAWYRDLRAAAGAYAAGPDFAAAVAAAVHLPAAKPGAPPPIVGVVNAPPALARLVSVAGHLKACVDLVSSVKRVYLAASFDGVDATGEIALELAGADPSAAAVAPPPGWATAREGAPLQAEWTADLDRVAAWLAPCYPDARGLSSFGVRAAAAFVQQLDVDDLSGRAAAWFVGHDTRVFDEAVGRIPGLSLVSHDRTVAGVGVTDVSVPMGPKFSYARTRTSVTAAIGDGLIDAIVGGRAAPATRLMHLELHPHGLSDETWQKIFEVRLLGLDNPAHRTRTLRRLLRWDLGQIDLDASPGMLVLTAHGRVHR
jgi:hypothetical protein